MNIPVLVVQGEGVAEVWEKSLLLLWEKGIEVKTEYDQKGEPLSKDCSMTMVIRDPFSEPRIHLGFCGGMEDLEKYRQEVVEGIHDAWIKPEEGKWTYTYHQRLFSYLVTDDLKKREGLPFKSINQVDYLIDKLSKTPYSRRAQAITWIPLADPETDDPPCLQRIWCRLLPQNNSFSLQMHTHWRSRDAYRAAFMNIFALTELQKVIAEKIKKRIEKEVKVGQYVDISDSYHIYGVSFLDFTNRFLKLYKERDFYNDDHRKSRTIKGNDPLAIIGFEEGKRQVLREKEG